VLIKAAINGGRSKAEHQAVPVSPEEQAAAVVECLKAGAGAIHLHVRGTFGALTKYTSRVTRSLASEKESLYVDDVSRTLEAVRNAAPDSAVGISTGAWILPDLLTRLKAVAAWEVLPDFASVNFIEEGAAELAGDLMEHGVDIEIGLSEATAAEIFLQSALALEETVNTSSAGKSGRLIRVLIEPQEQEMEEALANVSAIENVLTSKEAAQQPALSKLPRLLHGTETTAWPMLDEAIRRGYGVRIGFEDTLFMPDERRASDNAELVSEAVRRVRDSGR
jgi:uncharacterized protein (DUF849 family)